MEGFTLALALVDAIPVLFFGISMLIIGSRFGSILFMIGAALSFIAGCFKVAWKLILALKKKDVKWLNKPFLPVMGAGFLLIILSIIIDFKKISWSGVISAIISLPAVIFFALWIILMIVMVWYRKTRFKQTDAGANWTAQIINAAAQVSLLLGIILAK